MPARRFASLVKIEHTVFALPYAYVGAILAVSGWPGLHGMLWITVAMAGARSFAMAANRLIDAAIDARNPRTASRELPAGLLSRMQVVVFAPASLVVFLIAVWQLDPITHWLWPFVIVPMVIYPYLKRVTPLCHLWLGLVDGLAPIGAWAALTGHVPLAAWLLGAAVALWIAGFDVIYATFDLEIDRAQGLHSLPVDFGLARALTTVRVAAPAPTVALLAGGRAEPVARARLLRGRRDRRPPARVRELHRAPGRPLAGRRGLLLGERGDRRPVSGGGRDRRRALARPVAAPVVELLRLEHDFGERPVLRGVELRRRASRVARAVRRRTAPARRPLLRDRGGAAPPVARRGAHRGRARARRRPGAAPARRLPRRTGRSCGAG